MSRKPGAQVQTHLPVFSITVCSPTCEEQEKEDKSSRQSIIHSGSTGKPLEKFNSWERYNTLSTLITLFFQFYI